MKPKKHLRRQRFTLMETVVATTLLAVLFSFVFTIMDLNRRLVRQETMRRQALLAVDNTLERLAACPARTAQMAETILRDEVAKSALADLPGIRTTSKRREDKLYLRVITSKGRQLAQVILPTLMRKQP